jgi:hypothetical protein
MEIKMSNKSKKRVTDFVGHSISINDKVVYNIGKYTDLHVGTVVSITKCKFKIASSQSWRPFIYKNHDGVFLYTENKQKLNQKG